MVAGYWGTGEAAGTGEVAVEAAGTGEGAYTGKTEALVDLVGSWERVGRTQKGRMQSVVLVGIWEMPSKIQEEGWAVGTCWRCVCE